MCTLGSEDSMGAKCNIVQCLFVSIIVTQLCSYACKKLEG